MFDVTLPLTRTIDLFDPLAVLPKLAALPYPFLLHSSLLDERSRWSFFGADPFAVFPGGDDAAARQAFERAAAIVRDDGSSPTVVPFTGGAVGYWAYDYGRRLERLRGGAIDDLGLPDFVLGLYDVVGAYDHFTRQCWLFSSGLPAEGNDRYGRAEDRLDQFSWLLSAPTGRETPRRKLPRVHAASNFHPDEYRRAIERIQDHIARGDIYQANLSQRWSIDHEGDPAALAMPLFRALSKVSASPYAAYFGAGDHAVVSSSPERFLEVRGRRIETRPIKGTRRRGGDAFEDARMEAELLASEKDRAENVMIVDVLRNDLGRVCEPGTVRTTQLCALERFPQVFHLTSTIAGMMREDAGAFDVLAACFPGGSITGAPKIRAMEILDTVEPVRRHIYTGSLGYVDGTVTPTGTSRSAPRSSPPIACCSRGRRNHRRFGSRRRVSRDARQDRRLEAVTRRDARPGDARARRRPGVTRPA